MQVSLLYFKKNIDSKLQAYVKKHLTWFHISNTTEQSNK